MMRSIIVVTLALCLLTPTTQASEEGKTWPASNKAKTFVKDTIVIGLLASPWGTGWTKDEHFHDDMNGPRRGNHQPLHDSRGGILHI